MSDGFCYSDMIKPHIIEEVANIKVLYPLLDLNRYRMFMKPTSRTLLLKLVWR